MYARMRIVLLVYDVAGWLCCVQLTNLCHDVLLWLLSLM